MEAFPEGSPPLSAANSRLSLCVCVCALTTVSGERGEGATSLQPAAEQQDVPADLHPHAGGSALLLHEGPRERGLAADGRPAGTWCGGGGGGGGREPVVGADYS